MNSNWIKQIGGVTEWPDAAVSVLALFVAVLLGLLGYIIIFKVLLRLVDRPDTPTLQSL